MNQYGGVFRVWNNIFAHGVEGSLEREVRVACFHHAYWLAVLNVTAKNPGTNLEENPSSSLTRGIRNFHASFLPIVWAF